MNIPTLAILNFSFRLNLVLILNSFTIKNKMIAEKNTLYHVNKPSFKEISFPNTPEKPSNITLRCNNKYEFFIKNCLSIPFFEK